MSVRNMRRGIPNLFKEGTKTLSGLEQAVLRNIEACVQLADLTRTSFGPNGMNKLIINHLEKIFVTSDCMTILSESEIQHPAAKMVVMAAAMQEKEIGDNSNYVISLCGALLSLAADLVKMGLHPSEIIAGYEKAGKKACEILDELTVTELTAKQLSTQEALANGIMSAVAAKQFGQEQWLSPLIAKACLMVMPKNVYNFNVDNVRVCKVLGGSLDQSEVVNGMVCFGDTSNSVKKLHHAKVAVYTCSIGPQEAETKGTVLIESAKELMAFSHSEEKEIDDMIKGIRDSGVTCVVTGSAIDDMALHFLDKYGIMAVKVHSKFELRRLCRACKARPLVNMTQLSPEDIGFCSEIYVKEVGATRCTIFAQDEKDESCVATLLLRASTNNILNDVDRAIDDGVNVVKAMCKFTPCKFVAGAGACDIEISRRLMAYGMSCTGLEQYAIKKFAEAFEFVPRTLAENGGHDALDCVSALLAAHEKGHLHAGLDIASGEVLMENKVLDLTISKKQAISLARDTVCTILRVDQIIVAKQAGGPKVPNKGQNWDED